MGEPTIRGGKFIAPVVAPTWDNDTAAAAESTSKGIKSDDNNNNDNVTHPMYPTPEDTVDKYWANISVPKSFFKDHQDHYENDMDTGDDGGGKREYDAYGIEKPSSKHNDEDDGAEKSERDMKRMNIKDLFDRERRKIRKNGSSLGATNGDGTAFKMLFPSNDTIKTYLLEKLTDLSKLMQFGSHRFARQSQELVEAELVLACPVHVSPLLLAMMRDGSACYRFTDAITSLVRLKIIRFMILELDTEDPEHKNKCRQYETVLARYVNQVFYTEIDGIVEEGKKPIDERAEKDTRKFFEGLVRRFAMACDAYTLARIHITEWMICDMLKISYSMRSLLMTPDMLPDAGALKGENFSILRKNLCEYLRDRNGLFCGTIVKRDGQVIGIDKKNIDPKSWNPMHLDAPKLEDRLALLERFQTKRVANPEKVMFGLHNGWISLHTLREYMLLLSTEPNKKREEMNPVLTEEQEKELERAAAVGSGMDHHGDEDDGELQAMDMGDD